MTTVQKRRRCILRWYSFFSTSTYRLRSCNVKVVGVEGTKIIDNPTNPAHGAFLHVDCRVGKRAAEFQTRYSAYYDNDGYTRDEKYYISEIVVDVTNKKWMYCYHGRLINWPARFKFTTRDWDVIVRRAKEMACEISAPVEN